MTAVSAGRVGRLDLDAVARDLDAARVLVAEREPRIAALTAWWRSRSSSMPPQYPAPPDDPRRDEPDPEPGRGRA